MTLWLPPETVDAIKAEVAKEADTVPLGNLVLDHPIMRCEAEKLLVKLRHLACCDRLVNIGVVQDRDKLLMALAHALLGEGWDCEMPT
jgi:hypothetical protein